MAENRLQRKFEELRRKRECGLVCYVVAGYPTESIATRIVDALVKGGADAIEIGIPFSDPIADGPSIQQATSIALEKGVTPEKALGFAHSIRARHPELPVLGMTYYNILLNRGVDHFIRIGKQTGIDGFIIPDLPVEEARPFVEACKNAHLLTVFLVSPNTSPERMHLITSNTTGFLYLVSVYGITGARTSFEEYSTNAVARAKKVTSGRVPVAVGFGISTPFHVKVMKDSGADAVIVGSAIVNRISVSENNKKLFLRLESYARTLKRACK